MKKIYSLLLLSIMLFFGCENKEELILLSAKKGEIVLESGWEKEYWSKQENYSDTPSKNYNTQVLVLNSDSLSFNRWYKKVNIKPYATYKVTGYIKTEGVVGETEEAGVGIGLERFEIANEKVFRGDTDWTFVEAQFNSEGDDSFMLECFLGKNGKAKGSVYFDNFQLEELSSKKLQPKITIDLSQKKEPMSPYIYGQFIEHMGKCIYGGIWAEMLTDRKFYYTPGISKSPWNINIDTLNIRKDASHQFSKGILPQIVLLDKDLTLTQSNLAVKKGQRYVGRLVLKAEGNIKNVTISLTTDTVHSKETFDISTKEYSKIPFSLVAITTSNNAKLEFSFSGKGKITLAAASLMPEDNIDGFRPDVLNLMKELNAPIYRWPGGNFVSGYNWKDGIGDPDKRPTKFERAWNGLEYNDVGVHEFMKLCDLLNAEANVAVNTGLGTAKMAAEEVEYFNGDSTTKMGKWRAENGYPESYNVKLWAVGNEMFGAWQLGHMPIEDYVIKHNKVAEAMLRVDANIDLVAVGFPGKWNDMMYSNTVDNMTYISEHFYRQDWHAGGLLTHVKQIPDAIREIAEEHRRCRNEIPELKGKQIKIALDEWNYWYGPHDYGLLGTRYFLRDALGIAAGINEFSRQSDIYYMANYAQTVNVIGAIKTTKTDSWLEGTGLALKLYRNHFGTQPVTVSGNPEPLDIAVATTKNGEYLTVSIINATHDDYPVKLDFLTTKISKEARLYSLSGENDMVYNDETNKEIISVKETEITIDNNTIVVAKESANIYTFKIK